METKITKELVKFLAKLGQLELTEQQVNQYQKELNEVVNYVTMIANMPTKRIKPRFHTTNQKNIFQTNNQPQNTFSQKQALANAQKTKKGMFAIPRILTK